MLQSYIYVYQENQTTIKVLQKNKLEVGLIPVRVNIIVESFKRIMFMKLKNYALILLETILVILIVLVKISTTVIKKEKLYTAENNKSNCMFNKNLK